MYNDKAIMSEITIKSWNELNDALFADAWRSDLQRYRSPFVYRGMSDAAYSLETTLIRLGGNYAELEPHLLRNFRKYAHRNFVERDTLWHWLSLAQHHGLPTRLLDWTVSPLVAAHFATSNLDKFNIDGVIWAVNHQKAHSKLPDRMKSELRKEGADYFTVEILSRSVESIKAFEALCPPNFVVFFEPPPIDDRIVNQFALFSVMPDPHSKLDIWLAEEPDDLYLKIIIPADLKWEIRDKLDQANITERVLFPGLDGLSRWQKRYYSPKR